MAQSDINITEHDPIDNAEFSRSLGTSHLSWSFDRATTEHLSGRVTSRAVGPLRISWINLTMGLKQWSGERTEADIRANPEAYVTFVMPIAGSIRLNASDTSAVIGPNEFGIWDSTRYLSFSIDGKSYEQISVLIPQRMLRARADTCAALHGSRVDKNNVLSEMCIQHMTTLSKFLNSQLRPYEISLSNVTTSLFDAVLASLYKAPRNRDILLEEMKNYIECYISDDTLSPKTLAAAFEISTRYAHKLFENDGCTIGEWILSRRLERSANDLANDTWPVTDIAFKWGFKDLGHYSRTFKKHFGRTPSKYRLEARA